MSLLDKSRPRRALILGATGLTGRFCLQEILASEGYERVVSIGRRSSGVTHPKLTEITAELSDLSDQADAFKCVDDIYCCLGTTIKKAGSQEAFRQVDFEAPLQAAKMGIDYGASQYFLISSLGADEDSKLFYLRTKGEVEEHISRLPYQAVHLFRPPGILGNRDETRTGEVIGNGLGKLLSPFLFGKLRKYRPMRAETIAKAMVAVSRESWKGIHFYDPILIRKIAG